jgi:hypothetical protein
MSVGFPGLGNGGIPVITGSSSGTFAIVGQDATLAGLSAIGAPLLAQTLGLNPNLMSASYALTSGFANYTMVYLATPSTATGIEWYQSVAGNYTANNFNGVSLYSYASGVLTQVASSNSSSTCWTATSNTYAKLAFTAPKALTAGVYYLGFVYNSSAQTTQPVIGSGPGHLAQGVNNPGTNSSYLFAGAGATTSFAASITMSVSLNPSSNNPWIALY